MASQIVKGLQAVALGSIGFVSYQGGTVLYQQRQERISQVEATRGQVEQQREAYKKVMADKIIPDRSEIEGLIEEQRKKQNEKVMKEIKVYKEAAQTQKEQAKVPTRNQAVDRIKDLLERENLSVKYLKEEIGKHEGSMHLQSREYREHQMYDLACHLKFQRLIKKLEGIIPEHTEFLEQLPQSIRSSEYPTEVMFDELQSACRICIRCLNQIQIIIKILSLMSETQLFTIEEPEFNTKTYWGRFEEFRATANPLHAFYTNQRINQMQALIINQKKREQEQFEKTGSRKVPLTQQQIREIRIAETVVSTAIHPDTGEMLNWMFRFSSFLPMNIPISFGFIFVAPTPFNTIFWQWINQTYNAALNYQNRNASSLYTTQDIVKSYCIATTSAIGVALAIRKMLEKQSSAAKGARLVMINSVSSFAACAAAGFLNAYFMRQTEMEKGIDVLDKDTLEPYGKSQKCAKKAVMQTAISRIFLVLTIFAPPIALIALERGRMIPKSKPLKFLLENTLLATELYFAVPIGLAYYDRQGTIYPDELEEEFKGLKNSKGEVITEFVFNKGL